MDIRPIPKQDRIEYLDVLRGIAILFIFVANIVAFSGTFYGTEHLRIASTLLPIDDYVDFISYTLVDGKFYSIFSLLFGIGFVIQQNNFEKHNRRFVPFFRRRMGWLLVIGLIHLTLIWFGDILTLYAILGLILIFFREYTNRQLLVWASVLLLLPMVHWIVLNLAGWNYPQHIYSINTYYWSSMKFPLKDWGEGLMADLSFYVTIDSFPVFIKVTVGNSLLRIAGILEEGRIFKVLGIFLIGVWTGRKIQNEALLYDYTKLRQIALWGLAIGLPMSILRTYIEFYMGDHDFWTFMNYATYALGTVPLAMGFAAGIALIWSQKKSFLLWFAPVGKMALTNYIMQSVIGITIFYGIGFGLAGKLGFTYVIGLAIVVFVIQVLLSRLWLRRFKYGPLEWVWRHLTYSGKVPIK
ncbi:MAG: DUF418 domain-containing protein [Cyclobacteriaceae bacterium]